MLKILLMQNSFAYHAILKILKFIYSSNAEASAMYSLVLTEKHARLEKEKNYDWT